MNQGWICPKCNTVWAPTVKKCEDCKPVVAAPVPQYYYPDWTYRPWLWDFNRPFWGGGAMTLCGDTVASGGLVSTLTTAAAAAEW